MAAKLLQRGEAKVGLFAESSKKGVKFVLESEKSILLAKGGFRIFLSILDIFSIYVILDKYYRKLKFEKKTHQ